MEITLISVTFFLKAMARSPRPLVSARITVPGWAGSLVFFMNTGMPCSTAGWMDEGWTTLAPK
ncbi:MAG: hypothetical protein BWY88_01157 [Synergistetes bacterium ADurb.Bin520]|nr:MAG: hypothetical protein BWY88_01157 [Synergistetes bacterium ADurb.Bin520]